MNKTYKETNVHIPFHELGLISNEAKKGKYLLKNILIKFPIQRGRSAKGFG